VSRQYQHGDAETRWATRRRGAESERGTCFHVGEVLGADADDTLEVVPLEERTERQIAERRLPLGMDAEAR
jgi:hypothetical protein